MKLSKTEAHILSTLEQSNGEVVSRQSFGIESESNSSSNVLEVMICRLRKKGWSIKNVKGVGYKLVPAPLMENENFTSGAEGWAVTP